MVVRSTGAIDQTFSVRTATTPRELVEENDGILLLALPVNGHKRVMEMLSPFIIDRLLLHSSSRMSLVSPTRVEERDGGGGTADDACIHVIISSHASLGAVYFLKVLREECHRRMQTRRTREVGRCDGGQSPPLITDHAGEEEDLGIDHNEESEYDSESEALVDDIMKGVKITAWGTTVVTARKTTDTSVHVTSVRSSVDYCTVPSSPPSSHHASRDQTLQARIEEEDVGIALSRLGGEGTTDVTTTTILSTDAMTTTAALAPKRELLLKDDGHDLCTALFGPRFRRREGGLLAITLSNLNPQNHLGIVLGNMSRMDPPPMPPPPVYTTTAGIRHRSFSRTPAAVEDDVTTNVTNTPSSSSPPWYQSANITPNIGRLMEALDVERLTIANAVDVDVRTIHEHFSWSFGISMETPVVVMNDGTNEDAHGGESTT